jgi:hypothetical protein
MIKDLKGWNQDAFGLPHQITVNLLDHFISTAASYLSSEKAFFESFKEAVKLADNSQFDIDQYENIEQKECLNIPTIKIELPSSREPIRCFGGFGEGGAVSLEHCWSEFLDLIKLSEK